MMILVQESYFEEQELTATDKVQWQQLEEQQEFYLVDAGPLSLPSNSSVHLLASQDLAHIQHQNAKQRKGSMSGLLSQEQLSEKENLELDLWGCGRHRWSPRMTKTKGAGDCAFPAKHMKLLA